jgi:predicted nucleotidyltransferase
MNDVDEKIERFLSALDPIWPGSYSAVLFGSVARGQHIPGWSDINLLLVADRLTPETLRAISEALAAWRATADALPLLFTLGEWQRAGDAYPLEIAEMRTGYRVLRGTDPVAGMIVSPGDLRAALEREFRGKLMRLRQGYSLFPPGSEEISEFLRSSASSVLLLCRGLLILTGGVVPPDPAIVVAHAARLVGFAPEVVQRVVAQRAESGWRSTDEELQAYLAAVESAARFVDHYQIGART